MPDFWLGAPAKLDWFLDPSDENQAAMGKWMEKIAPNLWTPKVQPIIDDAVKHYPSIEKWAMIGKFIHFGLPRCTRVSLH